MNLPITQKFASQIDLPAFAVRTLFASTVILLSAFISSGVFAQESEFAFGFGDVPLAEADYMANEVTKDTLDATTQNTWDLQTIPEFDARTRGWVSPPKNQKSCGSCWSFASIGTIESRILKDGGPLYDLSEQQSLSCNANMSGCCGGSGTALQFFYNNRPLLESNVPYAESSTACPTQRTVACGNVSGMGVPYLAGGFYAVERTVAGFKTSLLTHGPSYTRFNVFSDFQNHWTTASPGTVYKNSSGSALGGHAVLLIGWSDSKQAFLFKNSWGNDTGPDRDGTFWLSYTGHANDLNLQMFNISSLTRVTDGAKSAVSEIKDLVTSLIHESISQEKTIAVNSDIVESSFHGQPGFLKSLPISAEAHAQTVSAAEGVSGFGWYNNVRVNGVTRLIDTSGTTQISIYASDVSWRYAFGGPVVGTPNGDGGQGGNGWRFPNGHRFGIIVFQGDRYWNVTSTSSNAPTVIAGLSNTEPVSISVNDTNGNDDDNGGAFDLYVRRDN